MIDGLTAEQFYRLRDDRTNWLTESRDYHQLRVRVIAGRSTVESFSGQVQLLSTANMLARWCRQVDFGFPDAALHEALRVGDQISLHQRIAHEVQQADPFGQFVFTARPSSEVQYTLQIGGDLLGEQVDFTIDADGWTARAGKGACQFDTRHQQINPVGPALAACLGVADAFKVAVKSPDSTRIRNVALSTFNFGLASAEDSTCPMPEVVDLGAVQMVGVGSVGSAVVYLLRMLPLRGTFRFIDHDLVELVNLNRSPLFGIDEVKQHKVHVAAQYLRALVGVEAFPLRYDDFVKAIGRRPGDVDLVLSLANEFEVRSFIENNFPPLQVYGTTTSDWGINFHRHRPLRAEEDCSLCRFPVDVPHVPTFCSTSPVETGEGKPVDAALPFLSMGAAALVVADLIKLQLPDYPFTPNFAFIDLKDKLEVSLAYQRSPEPACQCRMRSRQIHHRYTGQTRFA